MIFSAEGHSIDAIQRAAYKFTDRFALELKRDGDNFVCLLHPAADAPMDEEMVNGFRTEVLDQTLRERIRDETAGVRNVILALAFSKINADDAADSAAEGDEPAQPDIASSDPPRAD